MSTTTTPVTKTRIDVGAPSTEAAVTDEQLQAQRMRRTATILAASLVVSAIVAGAVTVLARRAAQRRKGA